MGIQRYLDTLRELHKAVTPADWLKIGWDFLETMGVWELYGCDLDILLILDRIPLGSDLIGSEIIPEQGESVLLRDLWFTSPGYEILSKFNLGLSTTVKGFEKIQAELSRAGIDCRLRGVKEDMDSVPKGMSEGLASLILSKPMPK